MRLIDVDALIEHHCEGCSHEIREGCKTDPVCATLLWFVDAPTIEAEPVKHGRWVDRYNGEYVNPVYECSECKEAALYKHKVDALGNLYFAQALSAACPHCRAKMCGGADHD